MYKTFFDHVLRSYRFYIMFFDSNTFSFDFILSPIFFVCHTSVLPALLCVIPAHSLKLTIDSILFICSYFLLQSHLTNECTCPVWVSHMLWNTLCFPASRWRHTPYSVLRSMMPSTRTYAEPHGQLPPTCHCSLGFFGAACWTYPIGTLSSTDELILYLPPVSCYCYPCHV